MKRQIQLLICAAMLLPAMTYAQSVNGSQSASGTKTVTELRTAPDNTVRLSDSNDATPDDVFKSAEVMPQYPGGVNGLMTFLSSNLTYPDEAVKNQDEGRVIVQFIVEKNGSVSQAKVVRSVSKELDAEALRVCRLLSGFTPAYMNGKPVRAWYTLPIVFKMPIDEEDAPTQ